MSKVAPHVYDKAKNAAILEAARRIPRQKSYAELEKIQLSTDANGAALIELYTRILRIYLGVASAVIPGSVKFAGADNEIAGGVPVTVPNLDKKDLAFHIIQLLDHRVEGGPIVETAIRQMDNYCSAVRVLQPGDDPNTKEWFALDGAEISLPPHIFMVVRPSGYPMAYKKIENIKISRGILVKFYDHIVEFCNNPITTLEGKTLVDTCFFVIGEGQRYLCAQQLNVDHIWSDIPVRPSSLMAELIREWSDISEPILILWLSVIVEEMCLIRSDRDLAIFGNMKLTAESELRIFEAKYSSLVNFRDQGAYKLNQLAGGSLFLIKYRQEYVLKILMRLSGYRKAFLKCGGAGSS